MLSTVVVVGRVNRSIDSRTIVRRGGVVGSADTELTLLRRACGMCFRSRNSIPVLSGSTARQSRRGLDYLSIDRCKPESRISHQGGAVSEHTRVSFILDHSDREQQCSVCHAVL